MKRFLIIFVLIGSFLTGKAEHITGGEMYYRFVEVVNGLYRYQVTVKLFKSCRSDRQLSNPTVIAIFDRKTNERIQDITVPLGRTETLELTNPNKCITQPPRVCFEVGYYEFELLLPASVNGYIVSCQVVFRIAGISNFIEYYGSIGATYTSEIPFQAAASNSSARFVGSDMVVVCENNSFSYSFAAQDADGDELRYSFCNAYQGGSFGSGGNVPPPATPPYSPVPYGSGFDGGKPLGANVHIDAKTGLIKGIAPLSGIYVVTVCVEEIRNGVVIASQRKDLQLNVSSCSIAAASLLPEYMVCKDSKTLQLSNYSTSPLIKTYSWEILNSEGTSLFSSPNGTVSYTFPDTGIYRIKLLINKDIECSDSMVSTARVYPGLKTAFDASGICFKKATNFLNSTTVVYGTVDSWKWDFGEATTINDFSNKRDASYQYPTMGSKKVQLMVSTTKGCLDTLTKTIDVVDKPPIDLPFRDTIICRNDVVQLIAKGSGSFSWSPVAGITNANSGSPSVSPSGTTTYFVDMDDQGCLNRDSVTVKVVEKVFLQAMQDTLICSGDTIQLRVNSDGLQYAWNNSPQLNNDKIRNPVAVTQNTTNYQVTATIGGCSATDEIVVRTVPYPKVNAGMDTVICDKTAAQLSGSTDGASWSWSPKESLSSAALLNTAALPAQSTAYILTAFDTKGCPKAGRDTVVVTVLSPIKPFAGRDTVAVLGQKLQLTASGGDAYKWSPETNLSAADIANPVATYNSASEGIRYKVMIFNEAGCADSAFVTVKVFGAEPTVYVPTAFTPNGDGRNDKLKPVSAGMQRLEFFRVYNRWGQLVYNGTAEGQGWDGTIAGKMQNSDSFIWMVKAIDYNGRTYTRKGVVTLIR